MWLAIEIIIIVLVGIPTIIAFVSGAPFVPTPFGRAKKMVELADLKPNSKIYELGCGDGRITYLARKHFSADSRGFELSPIVFLWAKFCKLLWRSDHKIYLRDFRGINLSDADVVAFYLLPEPIKKLKDKLERELRPGTKVISYAFSVDGWTPTYIEPKIPEKNYAKILVYEMGKHLSVIPANSPQITPTSSKA